MAVQIELGPLGVTQFAGAHEYQRRELQGASRDDVAGVAVDGPQQLTDPHRLGDRREMFGDDRRKRAPQVRGRIALGAFGLHGIAKHLRAALAGTVRGFVSAAALDTLEYLEYVAGA